MAHWGTDESTIDGHFGDSRAEVVAILATIVGEPGSQEFL